MLPKAVLSWVGRLVGIAAVVASPLVARAAEASDVASAKEGHDGSSSAEPRSGHHHKATPAPRTHAGTKARKKSAHKDASSVAKCDPKPSARRAASRTPKDDGSDEAKSDKAANEEVIAEHASTRSVPKPSKTPLPTVAAAATCPLVAVKARDAAPVEKGIDRGHAVEPRSTPILRASTRSEHAKKSKPPCLNAPIEITRGSEDEAFSLTKCDGSVLPSAVDQLSVLVRPGSAARPQEPIADEAKAKSERRDKSDKRDKRDEIAPGIKRIDSRLVERIQLLVDHFAKPGKTPQLFVVSGYRPTSKGSFHATGRAIDFRLEGIENTDLVAFCKTLDDTGCGFYPNSSFIHMDVRDPGAGHIAWIDASSPGEKPDYLAEWPKAPEDHDADAVKLLARMDELEFLPKEEATLKNPAPAKPVDTKPACAAGEEDAPAVVEKTRDGN